nr:hypothetical protein [Acetobacter malorum]
MDQDQASWTERWVRVMADYSSSGVWEKDGCEGDEDALPISHMLKERLKKWTESYEHSQFYLPENMRAATAFDLEGFAREGLEIAKALKAEMPDWTVIYHDEKACHAKDDCSDRSTFEYEVLLP